MREHPKIFGIGLSRTGTTSLNEALRKLGYRARHFPCEPRTRRELSLFLADPGPRLQLSILLDLDAITDSPACVSFKALDASYPGSRFVLTTRDEEPWLRSCEAFWKARIDPHFRDNPNGQVTRYVKQINTALFGGPDFNAERFRQSRTRFHEQVEMHFAGTDRLLVLDVTSDDAWTRLGTFLGCEISPRSFPHRNRGR